MCADFLRRLLTKDSPPLPGYKLDESCSCDFTDVPASGVEYTRGGRVYNPPYGWRRFVLASHNNKKLMKATRALDSPYTPADGDWAVSYRGWDGNAMDKNIKCPAGLCSTPDVEIASQFAGEIEWQGRRYKIMWQSLVNPENLQTAVRDGQQFWVAAKKENICRVAYCLKPLK